MSDTIEQAINDLDQDWSAVVDDPQRRPRPNLPRSGGTPPAVVTEPPEASQSEFGAFLGNGVAGVLRAMTTGKYIGIQPRTVEDHVGALLRHLGRYVGEPTGVDSESGLSHLDHVLARAFLLAFEEGRK